MLRSLESIRRAVHEVSWGNTIHERAAQEYGASILNIHNPETYRVNLLSFEELKQFSIPNPERQLEVADTLRSEMPTSFSEELTVATRGITAIGKRNKLFIAKLDYDHTLASEREAAIGILEDIFEVDLKYRRFNFFVYLGALRAPERKNEIRYELNPLLPDEIKLRDGRIKPDGK